MEIKNYTGNGKYKDSNNKRHFCNAHLSYKGRSIIIDYEWILHDYGSTDVNKKKAANLVPFEVYPYDIDIYVGYAKLDTEFGKYFGMLITEAKFGDLPGFTIINSKYNN